MAVERFLADGLGLDVVRATPEAHDREMAYVQELSHLVARSFQGLAMPDLALETTAFARLDQLVELVGGASPALFGTVVGGNPFAPAVLGRFVGAARALLDATCGGAG